MFSTNDSLFKKLTIMNIVHNTEDVYKRYGWTWKVTLYVMWSHFLLNSKCIIGKTSTLLRIHLFYIRKTENYTERVITFLATLYAFVDLISDIISQIVTYNVPNISLNKSSSIQRLSNEPSPNKRLYRVIIYLKNYWYFVNYWVYRKL